MMPETFPKEGIFKFKPPLKDLHFTSTFVNASNMNKDSTFIALCNCAWSFSDSNLMSPVLVHRRKNSMYTSAAEVTQNCTQVSEG